MSTTIEQLELEVQSNSTSAVSGIEALASSLGKLKNATKGGVGLTAVAKQLTTLNSALEKVSAANADTLNKLSSSLGSLASLKGVKLSPTISKRIVEIGDTMSQLEGKNYEKVISQIERLSNSLATLSVASQGISGKRINGIGNIARLANDTNALAKANDRASQSYARLAAKLTAVGIALKQSMGFLAKCVNKTNEYIENMNLFSVSMGEFAEEAERYAQKVGEVMGINPGEFMRNQGIFMTLAKGFGVAADRAHTMSQNLTQLGYDLSSFYNLPIEETMLKVRSALSGELEPLRNLGYDLSVARLQQEAYTLGISKKVNAMTQAEKAELRYYTIMKQVDWAHGDMARTLEAPANQLRILKAQIEQCAIAWGNLFLPVLKAVLPYIIAVTKALRIVAEIIAGLFGVELPKFDTGNTGVGGLASGAGEAADNLGDATKKAKELKNALLGIDELNVISPPEDSKSGAGGIGDIGGGGGLGFELPTYDFIGDAVNKQVDEIMKKLQPFLDWVRENITEILAGVLAIGAAFLAWKIAKNVLRALEWLSTLKGFNIMGSIAFKITGLGLFLDAWNTMKEAIQDIIENGANFTNVTKLIGGFAEALGASFLLFGNVKLGGASLVIAGVAGIVSNISDIVKNGLNWDNALSMVKNLGLFISGIGFLFMKDFKLAGIGLMISGASLVVENLKGLITAIKTGDWSDFDVIETASGALLLIGGFILTLKKLDDLKEKADVGKQAVEAIQTVTTTTSDLDTTVSTKLSPNLTSLVKNIGMGVLILGEVAAGAVIFAGAIAVVGWELGKAADAWQPVIENAGTVAIAIGVGTGLLAGVGGATYALGSVGKTAAINIGIGTAILAELGVAAGLFIVEIWAIGKGLDEIGKAWQPVLNNGETIATGIGIGTGLLVGIGVVTAALGAATVASAGLLPVAIGLGTTILVELAAAFILFNESLVNVADELNYKLAPSLRGLNEKVPTLTSDMSSFVDFMGDFAGEVVDYTKHSAIAGLSATIDTIVGWFTADPIDKLASDVEDISDQTSDLNEKLRVAVPELQTAINLLRKYKGFLSEMESLTNSNVNLSTGMFVNMKEVGQKLVTGFVDGIKSKSSDFSNAGKELVNGFKTSVTSSAETCKSTMIAWASNVKNWFTQSSFGGINRVTFQNYGKDITSGFNTGVSSSYPSSRSSVTAWASNIKQWFTGNGFGAINRTTFQNYAKDIVGGFGNGISQSSNASKTSMVTWATNVKNWFSEKASRSVFYDIARDVVSGFNSGINDLYDTSRRYMQKWASDAIAAFKKELDSHSPSRVFEGIAGDTVLGYNLGIANLGKSTNGVVADWVKSFTSVSPVMSFAVDTSALRYYSSDSFAKTVSADVTTTRNYPVTGFKEGMEEFYREYVEPTLTQMADDMRRQADKNEQTVVQIGNRTVSDAVTTQRKANGYVFVR